MERNPMDASDDRAQGLPLLCLLLYFIYVFKLQMDFYLVVVIQQ
jgi:hypothetical protein